MGCGELVLLALAHGLLLLPPPCASAVDRGQFPGNFLFGTSTSAYQVRSLPWTGCFSGFCQPPT
jgi:hypothetical protein